MVIKVCICPADLQWNMILRRGWCNCFSQGLSHQGLKFHIYLDWFYMLFDHLCRLAKTPVVDPSKHVENSFRSWNDVERRRNCATILKIGDPKFASSELPFCISFFLKWTIIIICFISGQWGSQSMKYKAQKWRYWRPQLIVLFIAVTMKIEFFDKSIKTAFSMHHLLSTLESLGCRRMHLDWHEKHNVYFFLVLLAHILQCTHNVAKYL